MNEQLTISTPEQVAFEYETAGIGSRSLAALLDHLIIGLVLFLVSCAAISLIFGGGISTLSGNRSGADQTGVYIIAALLILANFLILWGYFALFETVWHGVTPGKRAAKLRVVKRDGQPIGAGEALTRNLLRIADFMPGFYAIGLIAMFVDKDVRRLGDMVAGTIVVRESEPVTLREVQVAAPAPTPSSYGQQPYAYGSPSYAPEPARVLYDPLPGVSIRDVTPDDYRLIREVLERVKRGELRRDRAQDLASRLAYGVAQRMGHDFRDWQSRGWEPLIFLESVLAAREARGA